MHTDVLIIGGGLAGLACANSLENSGIPYILLEASDEVGGRVRTDRMHGFLLDRGFQVFSSAYPEAKKMFDYSALGLHHFSPGALVRFQGKWHRTLDPFRTPSSVLPALFSPIGTLSDKIRVAKFRQRTLSGSIEEIFQRPESSTFKHLQSFGFSSSMIDRFFRPFLGGVFLDTKLATSSRMTEFVIRMFASGDIGLPAQGMGALTQQLASNLPSDRIRTQARVSSVQERSAVLDSGESLSASIIVLATDSATAAELVPSIKAPPSRTVHCLYFSALEPPISGPYLLLNGEGRGPINNLCVLTQIAPSYTENSSQLISVSVLNNKDSTEEEIKVQVQQQLQEWFGSQVREWHHIRTYTIKAAQPEMLPPFPNPTFKSSRFNDALFVCGDFCSTGTIDGALLSGRRVANEIQQLLQGLQENQ